MKEGWEYKKLGEVCGKCSNIKWDDVSNEASYRYIDLTSVDRGDLHIHNPQNIRKDNAPSRAKQIIKAGDVIFATTRPTLRRVSIIEEQYDGDICSTGFCVLRHNEVVKSRFVFYALLYDGFYKYIEPLQTGANYPAVTDNVVKNYIIPVPPLSEQQRIVDYLDSAFAKIDAMKANAEKSLNEAKALFQASLKEMLEPKEGTKWGTIGDLFETYSGGTPTKSNKEYYEGGSIPWLRSGEVCQKEITETEMFITEKGLKESSAKYYPENTVVVAMYGATAAQVGILRIVSTSNQAVCGILPQKDFLSEFIYYWFSSIEDKLAAQAQGGAQPNISQQKIKKVEIPIYSITEQQSIVATLDSLKSKVDRLQANFEKISQECDALKQAILKQVFE